MAGAASRHGPVGPKRGRRRRGPRRRSGRSGSKRSRRRPGAARPAPTAGRGRSCPGANGPSRRYRQEPSSSGKVRSSLRPKRLQQLFDAKGRLTRGEASSVQELAPPADGRSKRKPVRWPKRWRRRKCFRLALGRRRREHAPGCRGARSARHRSPPLSEPRQSADARLERVITALKPDAKKPGEGQKPPPKNGEQGGEGGPGGDQGAQAGNRSIAELKLLKALRKICTIACAARLMRRNCRVAPSEPKRLNGLPPNKAGLPS